MTLSANINVETKKSPVITKLKCVDGALAIYRGALLEYEKSNIGYVQPASADVAQTNQSEFAGIALEEKTVAAADNTADGTIEISVLSRGCGDWVLLTSSSALTIAHEGDPVYMKNDLYVATSATNSTGGFVGIIRQFVSTTTAWVQLVQSPTL